MRSQGRLCALRKAGIKKARRELRTPAGLDLPDLLKIVSGDGRALAQRFRTSFECSVL
jgi:invasion protein IalB